MSPAAIAYIDAVMDGRIPATNSTERIDYEKAMTDGYDYTWAIQAYQAIRAEVGSELHQ